ncbi:hypothetical protein NRB56_26680 [Nocardia sp. RB56]|uniref:ATP-binding protein n=2 Tax=Nocardia aurantia TaxID=2585199 RepID=A0A7K0DMW7_9NOCA|nr:hypothetical protein [Nocardia aurantia]
MADPVRTALAEHRTVILLGARRCGKSAVVAALARECGVPCRSLDQPTLRRVAAFDPVEFVVGEDPVVIDGVPQVPELLPAVEKAAALGSRPGRFLLTGSVRAPGFGDLPTDEPGRTAVLELWPLSQGELDGRPDGFVDRVFAEGARLDHDSGEKRAGYVERIVRGGFPEAVSRTPLRRRRFFETYLNELLEREIGQLAEIERVDEMRLLTRLVASRSGQLLMAGTVAGELGMAQRTVARYLTLLEDAFLLRRIPAWTRDIGTRAVSAAKVAVVDSGLATHLVGVGEAELRSLAGPLGPLLEGFVTMEIARQLTWSAPGIEMFHYRTRDQLEVDIVLENRRGQVVAVDVKAASTVRDEDFRGLRHLADRLGADLVAGIVLHTGPQTLAFGPRLRAVPIGALWES